MNKSFFESKPLSLYDEVVRYDCKIKLFDSKKLLDQVEQFLEKNGYKKDSVITFDYQTDNENDFLMIEKTSMVIERIIELSQVLYNVDDEKLIDCITQNSKYFFEQLSNCYFESANNLLKIGCRKIGGNSRFEELININAIDKMLKKMKKII